MVKDRLHWHLLVGFALALGIYLAAFSCDQRIRTRKGPWMVRFGTNNAAEPFISVSQPALGITNVQITFAGELATNPPRAVVFDRPGPKQLPFGGIKFEDLTYLPGSVTFDFYGHEVELLPRTLYLNKREYPWQPGASHRLEPGEKMPSQPEAGTNSAASDQTLTNVSRKADR